MASGSAGSSNGAGGGLAAEQGELRGPAVNIYSARVKCVGVHPTLPRCVVSTYAGGIFLFDTETYELVADYRCSTQKPCRTARFVPGRNWIVGGTDEFVIFLIDMDTHEMFAQVRGHLDYIRMVLPHPTEPLLISCSDDQTVKIWDLEPLVVRSVVVGASHYVMWVAINPRDTQQYASASLDRTVRVYRLGSDKVERTLNGHGLGVIAVEFHPTEDWLVSTSDDKTVKVWALADGACLQTLRLDRAPQSFFLSPHLSFMIVPGINSFDCFALPSLTPCGRHHFEINAAPQGAKLLDTHDASGLGSAVPSTSGVRVWSMAVTNKTADGRIDILAGHDNGLSVFSHRSAGAPLANNLLPPPRRMGGGLSHALPRPGERSAARLDLDADDETALLSDGPVKRVFVMLEPLPPTCCEKVCLRMCDGCYYACLCCVLKRLQWWQAIPLWLVYMAAVITVVVLLAR